MKYLILILSLTIFTETTYGQTVRDWWLQCKGSFPESTCLTEKELSKFKTICSNKVNREDCQKVVDYIVAKTRTAEGRSILINGYKTQVSNFTINKKYLTDPDKIWGRDQINSAYSFAVGVLPSCNPSTKKKLLFSKNTRPEVIELQDQFYKIYESIASLPCPDSKNGFVLVTIGKVVDSYNEYEVFTLDEKQNLKVIRTAISAGPFISKK